MAKKKVVFISKCGKLSLYLPNWEYITEFASDVQKKTLMRELIQLTPFNEFFDPESYPSSIIFPHSLALSMFLGAVLNSIREEEKKEGEDSQSHDVIKKISSSFFILLPTVREKFNKAIEQMPAELREEFLHKTRVLAESLKSRDWAIRPSPLLFFSPYVYDHEEAKPHIKPRFSSATRVPQKRHISVRVLSAKQEREGQLLTQPPV